MTSMRLWAGVLLAAAATTAVSAQQASPERAWPERAIQAIVPFAAGAANDIVGRIVLEQIARQGDRLVEFLWKHRLLFGGAVGANVAMIHPQHA